MSEREPSATPKRGDSGHGETQAKQHEAREAFVCAKEASDLLNCVTGNNYNELKCVHLIKKLRECVKKKGVVSFSLLPDESLPPAPPTSPQPNPDPEKSQTPLRKETADRIATPGVAPAPPNPL